MIKIEKPYLISHKNTSRLICDLLIDESEIYSVWFEVESQYSKYLCTELIDGIVVNILLYCMENGHDIKSDIPISERLFYHLDKNLIPAISKYINKYKRIKIYAPLTNLKFSGKGVGTGISGGVDSFYTILKNYNKQTTSFNVTHLCFFNAGASGNYGGDAARDLFYKRLEQIKPIANNFNLPLIYVDTNINELLHQEHVKSHTFRSLAIPLLLQKLFFVYYYASGYSFKKTEIDFNNPAKYDLLTTHYLSNENITFYSCGGETERIGKVETIANNEIAQKYLNVCISDYSNCSMCNKCKRTIMNLYALNQLENFRKVFDFEIFKKWKKQYIGYILSNYKEDTYNREIVEKMKENKIKFPLLSYLLWFPYYKIIAMSKKFYHFIRRKMGRNMSGS